MADFMQVMKDWGRMCKAYTDNNKCIECVLAKSLVCGQMERASEADIAVAESDIILWAARHPEPRFPTWGEYLCDIGLIHDCKTGDDMVHRLFDNSIPADIAAKLEIKPK